MNIAIWACALLMYLAFRLWYDGIRKPLTSAEVEEFVQLMEKRASEGQDTQDIAVARKFMEEDDGKEFIMLNMLQYNPSPLTHPDTGLSVSAEALLQEYFRPLMKIFLRRAGHPVLGTCVVGDYLEAWKTPPNPGWHGAGMIRYRSRRDAILVSMAHAEFDDIHKYKVAALKQTYAMPSQASMGLYASPRLTVALVLALGASLLQLLLS